MKFMLSDYEAKIVWEVVCTHKGKPVSEVIACLRFILNDIGPVHYFAVGLAIGELMSTEEQTLENQNHLTLWQNQN